jgi:RNase P subunit RPR2
MKIITKGQIPGERIHRATCNHCGTVFEFSQKEATIQSDQRDGDYMTILCPLCNIAVYRQF